MISYAMVGTKDLKKAGDFFDKVLGVVGASRMMESDRSIMWSDGNPGRPLFAACLPYDGNAATVGNGTMISFGAKSQEDVDNMYKVALENGGSCEGKPGLRGESYYLAYFRDMDGNKFSAFCPVG
ncbi:MAG: VOC family protein [Emcibacteraceae bacterium]